MRSLFHWKFVTLGLFAACLAGTAVAKPVPGKVGREKFINREAVIRKDSKSINFDDVDINSTAKTPIAAVVASITPLGPASARQGGRAAQATNPPSAVKSSIHAFSPAVDHNRVDRKSVV